MGIKLCCSFLRRLSLPRKRKVEWTERAFSKKGSSDETMEEGDAGAKTLDEVEEMLRKAEAKQVGRENETWERMQEERRLQEEARKEQQEQIWWQQRQQQDQMWQHMQVMQAKQTQAMMQNMMCVFGDTSTGPAPDGAPSSGNGGFHTPKAAEGGLFPFQDID